MNRIFYLLTLVVSLACQQAAPAHENDNMSTVLSNNEIPKPSVEDDSDPIAMANSDSEDERDKRKDQLSKQDNEVVKPVNEENVQLEEVKVEAISSKNSAVLDTQDRSTPHTESNAPKNQSAKQITDNTQKDLHDEFNQLLQKHVSSAGAVDYQSFLKNKSQLSDYLATMAAVDVINLPSRETKLAYWINLYNAATINLILTNYPVAKITDLDGGKTWDVKRVKTNRGALSLNDIENGILRPEFKDARIHFAVNCAAKSCPPLANQAFTESNLDSLLERRAGAFINDDAYNTISSESISISKIFDWYADDFTKNIIDYINVYSEIQAILDVQVTYKEYDWSLNGK